MVADVSIMVSDIGETRYVHRLLKGEGRWWVLFLVLENMAGALHSEMTEEK